MRAVLESVGITDVLAKSKEMCIRDRARASMISPDFVGHTVAVHNGNKFIPCLLYTSFEELRTVDIVDEMGEAAKVVVGRLAEVRFVDVNTCLLYTSTSLLPIQETILFLSFWIIILIRRAIPSMIV